MQAEWRSSFPKEVLIEDEARLESLSSPDERAEQPEIVRRIGSVDDVDGRAPREPEHGPGDE